MRTWTSSKALPQSQKETPHYQVCSDIQVIFELLLGCFDFALSPPLFGTDNSTSQNTAHPQPTVFVPDDVRVHLSIITNLAIEECLIISTAVLLGIMLCFVPSLMTLHICGKKKAEKCQRCSKSKMFIAGPRLGAMTANGGHLEQVVLVKLQTKTVFDKVWW